MRILFITHFFSNLYSSGTDNYTLGLARSLISRKHQVEVLCAEDWQIGRSFWNKVVEDTYEGIPVRRIHINWTKAHDPNKALYDNPEVEKWLEDFLIRERPDLVHVTSTYTLSVGVFRAVKRVGIPLILTLMDFWFMCPRTILVRSNDELCDGKTSPWECQKCLLAGSRLFRSTSGWLPENLQVSLWERISQQPHLSRIRSIRGMALDMHDRKTQMANLLKLPDRIISHSTFLKSCFEQVNLTNTIEHLPLGEDLSWLEHYSGKSKSDVLRFGFIGQISQHKGLKILVEAFRKILTESSASLKIWGNQNQNPQFTAELRKLIDDDPRIDMRGNFSRIQLGSVFSEIDILVVPSLWYENSPLVILEAFATGTPVIASNLGGMSEAITDEKNGLLFEAGDVTDLLRKMERLINDDTLISKLISGISPVKMIDEEVSQLEEIYISLIKHA